MQLRGRWLPARPGAIHGMRLAMRSVAPRARGARGKRREEPRKALASQELRAMQQGTCRLHSCWTRLRCMATTIEPVLAAAGRGTTRVRARGLGRRRCARERAWSVVVVVVVGGWWLLWSCRRPSCAQTKPQTKPPPSRPRAASITTTATANDNRQPHVSFCCCSGAAFFSSSCVSSSSASCERPERR